MSIHVHVYLEDIDTQLAVIFIANTSKKTLTSLRICAAFVTRIQNIITCTVNPFSMWDLLEMTYRFFNFCMPALWIRSLESRVYFCTSWLCTFALTSLNVSQYVGIKMCLHLSLCQFTFLCQWEWHLITLSSQLHLIKGLLFELR